MLDKLTQRLDFHGNALLLRAERQRTIASNIANADTPGFVARDFKFADAMRAVAPVMAEGHLPSAIEFHDYCCLALVGELLPFVVPG